MQVKLFSIFVASKGGLAQLARAFDWQSKGHRFDSDILHEINQGVATLSCDSLLFFELTKVLSFNFFRKIFESSVTKVVFRSLVGY